MGRTRWATDIPESEVFGRFFKVPHALYEKNLLKYATSAEVRVMFALLKYRWKDSSVAFVGVKKLAQATGLNPKTVMNATKGLVEMGLVKKSGTTDQRILRYELLPYGSDLSPDHADWVMRRLKRFARPRCSKLHDKRGRFLPRQVEAVQGPRRSTPSGQLPDKPDPSTRDGHLTSSGDGVQNSTTSGHHIDVPLEVPETY